MKDLVQHKITARASVGWNLLQPGKSLAADTVNGTTDVPDRPSFWLSLSDVHGHQTVPAAQVEVFEYVKTFIAGFA